MTSSEINRQEMVHYFKSFTSLFSLFLLIEDPVTLICSKEGFQYLSFKGLNNPGSVEQISNTNLCILTRLAGESVY